MSPDHRLSRIAITGATGFIGSTLVEHAVHRGIPVRALARSPAAAERLHARGAEVVTGDLHDHEALIQLTEGCDAVLHCAGAVRGASYEDFAATNVTGTRHLIDATATAAPRARLLLFSSLAAREPQLSWYGRSKLEAESILRQAQPPAGWTILRPPAVFGPGDRELMPLFQQMNRGILPVPGSPEARVSLIHVDDLAEAAFSCLATEDTGDEALYLCDGRAGGYSWRELAQIAGDILQRRVRPVRVPRLLLDSLAHINLALSRPLGRQPMLTPSKLRELRHPDWVVENDTLSTLTGWQPKFTLESFLRETLGAKR